MSSNLRLTLIAIAAVVIVAAGGIYYYSSRPDAAAVEAAAEAATPAATPAPGASSTAPTNAATDQLMVAGPLGDHALGDPKAPNVVIEYASLTCSHCQRFHTTVFEPFKTKYIDTGKVYFIYRSYPLNDLDIAAIMVTACQPADRYFALVDLLYDRQKDWTGPDPVNGLKNVLKQAGVTEQDFTNCLKNQSILDGVNEVRNRASKEFGVNATPTFFVNGEVHPGEQTLEDLDKLLGG